MLTNLLVPYNLCIGVPISCLLTLVGAFSMIVISSRRFVESSNHHSQQPLYKEQISNLPTFRSWLTGCAACGEQSIICGRNLWGAQENTLYLVKILIHCFCEVSRLLFVCPALWPNRADVCRAPAHPAPWPAGMGEDGGYNTVNFSWRKLSLSNYIFFGLGAVDDYRTQRPWVRFWGPKNEAASCTHLGPAQVMEVIIIDV